MRKIPHVAVLIETSRAYGRGLLEGVARFVRENGPWSIYFRPHALGEPPPPWLRRWKGDGILVRIDNRETARAVRATGLPAVDLRGRVPGLGLPRVGVDNRVLARLAAEHLLERGFRRFGFCGIPRGEHPHLYRRGEDFLRLIEEKGYPCAVFPGPNDRRAATWEKEQDRLAAWVAGLPKPVGVMACNDDRGQQLLDACRRAGVLVPDEVAVIGVENDPILCNLATPTLTSIDVNPQQVGYTAAALLDRLMAGDRPPPGGVFLGDCRVVTRQSTDVLALDDPELARAVHFIREHACEGIRVADVLAQVSMSRSVLERRCKQVLGRAPKALILGMQIERARQLLAETDLPLKMVALKCGFRTAKYFGDAFHRWVGERAGAYRRRLRQPG
ncbi:MAG TPA: DNA-binding transcriptional regulator [Gemmataceae bacterium]|nr:DNA-binding transcriptional regulator [Gemmataceae bacterium]